MQIIPKVRLSRRRKLCVARETRMSERSSVLVSGNAKRYRRNYMPYTVAIYRAGSLVIFIPNETRMPRVAAFMYIHDHVSLTLAVLTFLLEE